MKRAIRRHHSARMKAKARRFYRQWNRYIYNWRSEAEEKKFEDAAAKRADHIKCCSCWMCGNPRKYLKELTVQEIKAILKDKEECQDLRG